MEIFPEEEKIKDSSGMYHYGKFSGNLIEIENKQNLISIPDTFVTNTNGDYIYDYDSIYVQNSGTPGTQTNVCTVSINPLVFTVEERIKGMYFCINGNGGAKILEIDIANNSLTLDPSIITYDIKPAVVEGEILITPAGFPCNFIGVFIDRIGSPSTLPVTSNIGDVANLLTEDLVNGEYKVIKNEWYMYKYGKWSITNLFDNENQFLDKYGNYVTKYLLFGANIIELEDITVSTNFGQCELDTSLLPRYI